MACPFQRSPFLFTSRSTHVLYRSLRHAGSRSSNPPSFYASCYRFSTGSSQLVKSRGASKKTRNPLSYNSPKPAAVAPSEYESTAQTLAKKPSPTLLYQSGSHLGYILGCYFAGGGLIGMGVFNSLSANMVPEGDYIDKGKILPTWLPYFVHTGSLFMVAVGAWICLRVCYPLFSQEEMTSPLMRNPTDSHKIWSESSNRCHPLGPVRRVCYYSWSEAPQCPLSPRE